MNVVLTYNSLRTPESEKTVNCGRKAQAMQKMGNLQRLEGPFSSVRLRQLD